MRIDIAEEEEEDVAVGEDRAMCAAASLNVCEGRMNVPAVVDGGKHQVAKSGRCRSANCAVMGPCMRRKMSETHRFPGSVEALVEAFVPCCEMRGMSRVLGELFWGCEYGPAREILCLNGHTQQISCGPVVQQQLRNGVKRSRTRCCEI